jgi:hypothetical protein
MNEGTRPGLPMALRLFVVLAWLWFLLAIPFVTDAACRFDAFLLLAWSGGLIGFVWLVVTLVYPALLKRPTRLRWLSVPLAGLLVVVLMVTGWGLLVRVFLCEGSLQDSVANVPANSEADWSPRRVGLFWVEDVKEYDGGVYLFTTQSFVSRHGVAHIPDGIQVAPRVSVRHLYGSWYSFEWRF